MGTWKENSHTGPTTVSGFFRRAEISTIRIIGNLFDIYEMNGFSIWDGKCQQISSQVN